MVRVSYAALNPLDLVMMRMPWPFMGNSIPGADFVGQVVQAGPSIPSTSNVRVGMTVCGTIPTMQIFSGGGTLAEYIILPVHMVVEKPLTLDDGAAAALVGVPGQTTAIVMRATEFRKGDRVLVKGASGGVGSVLVQVLRSTGVHVTAICSGKNEAMVRRLGAEEVLLSDLVPAAMHHRKKTYSLMCPLRLSTTPRTSHYTIIYLRHTKIIPSRLSLTALETRHSTRNAPDTSSQTANSSPSPVV